MSATQEVTTKRAYNKAPIVIRKFIDKDSKKQLIRFIKNHPRVIKKNIKKEEKEAKAIEKANLKQAKIEEKKAKHINAKEKCDKLSVDEKRFLVEKANEGLFNAASFTKAQKIHIGDYLIENTKNSVFVEMIKSGKLDDMPNEKVSKKGKTKKSDKDKEVVLNLQTLSEDPKGMTMMIGNEKLINPQELEGDDYEVIRFNE
tara:strand:+ start:48 stop:650 length:603 start_codon:yes stop_codon:yes gene_type:complete